LSGFWSKDAILGSDLLVDELWGPRWHHFGLTISTLMLVAAGMTSFYIFRLYFLVFSGESRADPHTKQHIHESPPVMTVPLLILALLSLMAGLIGTPFDDLFGEFLGGAPELHVPWANMALGTLSFAVGFAGAWACYYGGVRAPVTRFVAAVPWLYRVVFNKFYVDELYDLLFVRPTRWLARGFAQVFDRVLIDGLVGLLARFVDGTGYLVRQVQNGDVQRYLAAMVIGAAVMLWFIPRPPADFHAELDGGAVNVEVVARRGSKRNLEYCWRLDGSACKSTRPKDRLELPPGVHQLTLEVHDTDWGTSSHSRPLRLRGSI